MRPLVIAAVAALALGTASPAHSADPPPCAHPVLAPLASLAGDWTVRVHTRLSGNPVDWDTSDATSKIERTMRDCAWVERYEGSRRGRPFEVLRVYGAAPEGAGLRVVAADSEHGPLYLSTGAADSTGIAFFTTVTTPAGEVRLRLRLSEITADRFVLENHRSPDGGATWDRTGRAEYRRQSAARP